ncbi:MAG: dolichyl-phosphate beta-glucosyltransferase [Candidatus Magnetoglobus multicellularis str. Araruama]|uniref:Dolichyl-phosphate beta-glucosyltransferase n=1 Tax=Candidatus Magnetoglobus multicellularis str. Araruama TaxID=890399 RepID=A0A1V1PII7_9BACT|nr:MAG: dolichyl-phosphate beta-glucosyltransferase [Candidatus Magnetoglobus multicellularis str. Araruama]
MKSTFISIIIPGFNEEQRIQKTLQTLFEFCLNRFTRFEILFVDDGSDDHTRQIVDNLASSNTHIHCLGYTRNMGKGYAIRYGLKHAKGDYIFFTDADLPYDPQFLILATTIFDKTGCHFISGNRHLKLSHDYVGLSRKRQLASRIFSCLVQQLFGIPVTDTQCGIKGFTKACAREIIQKSQINGYAFDVEVFILAKSNRWHIEYLPVMLINNQLSKIRLGFDPLLILCDILRLCLANYK